MALYQSLVDKQGYTAEDFKAAEEYAAKWGTPGVWMSDRGKAAQQAALARLSPGGKKAYDALVQARDKNAYNDPNTRNASTEYVPGQGWVTTGQKVLAWDTDQFGRKTPIASLKGALQTTKLTPGTSDPQKVAEDQVMAATFGRGDDVLSDPRMAAALDALDPTKSKDAFYGRLTDSTAAQAGSQADMLREQMAQAGIQSNDPAAQARMRAIEAARMQANNAGLGQANQVQQSAASALAQARLSQQGLAQNAYGLGAQMLAQKNFNQQHVSLGSNPVVPDTSGLADGHEFQAWVPQKTQLPNTAQNQPAATGNTRVQTPQQPAWNPVSGVQNGFNLMQQAAQAAATGKLQPKTPPKQPAWNTNQFLQDANTAINRNPQRGISSSDPAAQARINAYFANKG